MIFIIRHRTTYHYRQPVAFGEHRMMLRPRDDDDQKVLDTELNITPAPTELVWQRDGFGNHIATASFAEPSEELRFDSTIQLDHVPTVFDADDIDACARIYPFLYSEADREALASALVKPSPAPELARWVAGFLDADGSAGTHDLLVAMTTGIAKSFKHVARHEKGLQEPVETVDLASGSCRDLAMLMIAGLRSLGIAARFVSGYLYVPADDHDDRFVGGNTHAWVQAFVPGAGWIDFDPSNGIVGNRNLVRVAVVPEPREAIPLQGTWFGSKADHLAMQVAVKVTAANGATGARWDAL